MSKESRGMSLVSQEFRDLIVNGLISNAGRDLTLIEKDGRNIFKDPSLENRIQTSSFEPRITDEVYVLDTETAGLFRPREGQTIYRTLLQLPKRQREKKSTVSGLQMIKGFSYLFPLQEKIRFTKGKYAESSPKSTMGRLFLNTRMIADYSPSFNEVGWQYKMDSDLDLWLLIQPLHFNVIAWEGLTFNQIRYFTGSDSEMTASEIKSLWNWHPFLKIKDKDGELIPAPLLMTDKPTIHLDLTGSETEGVVGLRARHTPNFIDLKSQSGTYNPEEFFEPVMQGNANIRSRRDHYLFASREYFDVPEDMAIELISNHDIGLNGPLDLAGFIDGNFRGQLVFEIRSDELGDVILEGDQIPISKLKVFRTKIPDKLYGLENNSNYQSQFGPRAAKYFSTFDWKNAAKTYGKLKHSVMVEDARLLTKLRSNGLGYEPISEDLEETLIKELNENAFYHMRYDCESDELVLQIIPYVIVFGVNNDVFHYVRANSIIDYGDKRLFGKHSIGIGGHLRKSDSPNYIINGMNREITEEIKIENGILSEPKLVGTLIADDKNVDRVHFGLIYIAKTNGQVYPNENALKTGGLMSIEDITRDGERDQKYETWSKILIPHLPTLYRLSE